MTESPEDTNQSGMTDAALAAHNRRYRNDVVRIGRVTHAEEKAESDERQQSDHLILDRGRRPGTALPIIEKFQIFGDSLSRLGGYFGYFHAGPDRLNVSSGRYLVKFYSTGEMRFRNSGGIRAASREIKRVPESHAGACASIRSLYARSTGAS